ncbi:MAG: hypothetical protein ACLRQF_04275 [Thomasclavelia ramosa]
MEEEFIPTDKWAPGVEINKKLQLKILETLILW